MVRVFDHPTLTDMKVLTDSDPEVDFFENIKHIQVSNNTIIIVVMIIIIKIINIVINNNNDNLLSPYLTNIVYKDLKIYSR